MIRPVAVTGATGRIGAPLVDELLRAGRTVRALSRRVQAARPGIEWVVGDLLDPRAVAMLVADAETVFHAGGELTGSPEVVERSLVQGTENVLRAAGSARVVHVSSLVVLDTGSPASPRVIDERSPLEPAPERRGHYTRAKAAAEAMARSAAARQDVVIVRPGLVVPVADRAIPPAVGIAKGAAVFFVGPRDAILPVVHTMDVAEGLVRAADRLDCGGILHLIDPTRVDREALFRRITAGGGVRLAVPSGAAGLLLAGLGAHRGSSRVANTAYRLRSAGVPHDWSTARALALGWHPGALQTWLTEGN
jgi:dihydroflavonol-4-reductase